MPTDRVYLKTQQKGALTGTGAVNSHQEVERAHTEIIRSGHFGAENAATATGESPLAAIYHNRKIEQIRITVNATITTDNSNYALITFRRRDASGANGATIATWNTHGGAQGTLTALTPATVTTLVTNSDAECTGGTNQITYQIGKTGSGVACGAMVFELSANAI